MGLLDTAKMIRKAQQARSQMKKITVAGQSKSGNTAILMNGLNDIEEIEFSDELFADLNSQKLEAEIIEAFKDAKKKLEQELAANFDPSSLADMFN